MYSYLIHELMGGITVSIFGSEIIEGCGRMKRVFLGGTCNGSTWRNELIPELDKIGVDYFNPVVEKWDSKAQIEEIVQRQYCDIILYVITSDMSGFYSIAEAIDDSNKRPDKTIFCVLYDGFNASQHTSLKSVCKMVQANGAIYTESLNMTIKEIQNKITGDDETNE